MIPTSRSTSARCEKTEKLVIERDVRQVHRFLDTCIALDCSDFVCLRHGAMQMNLSLGHPRPRVFIRIKFCYAIRCPTQTDLINLGFKQIFGAQSFRDTPAECHCLAPVEKTFSETLRVRISGLSLRIRISSLREANKENAECKTVLYCDKDLRRPPKGMFPGIW